MEIELNSIRPGILVAGRVSLKGGVSYSRNYSPSQLNEGKLTREWHTVSIIEDIGELRHKESDRIKSMEEGLINLGIDVKTTQNSIEITGGTFRGGIVNSYGDHRVAMSFIVSGFVSQKPITVTDTENINTSFPTFIDILKENNNEIYHL